MYVFKMEGGYMMVHTRSQPGNIILIVEDDIGIGSLLTEVIKSETDYVSLWVTDTQSALEEAQAIQPVLFILNYWLDHTNGLELYDQLHALPGREDIPAIMISANLPKKELERRNIIGLQKPFELNRLLASIEDMLDV